MENLLPLLPFVTFSPLQGFSSMLCLYDMFKYQFLQISINLKIEHAQQKADSYMPCIAMAHSTKCQYVTSSTILRRGLFAAFAHI